MYRNDSAEMNVPRIKVPARIDKRLAEENIVDFDFEFLMKREVGCEREREIPVWGNRSSGQGFYTVRSDTAYVNTRSRAGFHFEPSQGGVAGRLGIRIGLYPGVGHIGYFKHGRCDSMIEQVQLLYRLPSRSMVRERNSHNRSQLFHLLDNLVQIDSSQKALDTDNRILALEAFHAIFIEKIQF